MHESDARNPPGRGAVLWGLLLAGAVACGGGLALAADSVVISQKGRQFHPGAVRIAAGTTVEFLNDDGDLLHHAYVASDAFSFDSGDQAPGSTTDVVFTVPGTFTVLCGIHPKMKLVVTVH